MIEAKIHACPDSQDRIGPFQSFATGGSEEERVRWWQAATSRAIEENRGVDALRKLAEWLGGITPPDGGTCHDDRALRISQQGGRLNYHIGIGRGTTIVAVECWFARIEERIGIREVIQDIHGHF